MLGPALLSEQRVDMVLPSVQRALIERANMCVQFVILFYHKDKHPIVLFGDLGRHSY